MIFRRRNKRVKTTLPKNVQYETFDVVLKNATANTLGVSLLDTSQGFSYSCVPPADCVQVSSSGGYSAALTQLANSPIAVKKIKIIVNSGSSSQTDESFTYKLNEAIGGRQGSSYINPSRYKTAFQHNQNIVEIPLGKELIFDSSHALQYSVQPNTQVTVVFYYRQTKQANNYNNMNMVAMIKGFNYKLNNLIK